MRGVPCGCAVCALRTRGVYPSDMRGEMWRVGITAVAFACLLCTACDECDEGETRCSGNSVLTCRCPTDPLARCKFRSDGDYGCGEAQTCREVGGSAACTLANERCPDGRESGFTHCVGGSIRFCFGEFVRKGSSCGDGMMCANAEEGVLCVYDPEECTTATTRCVDDSVYLTCFSKHWSQKDMCPVGSTCVDDGRTMPCMVSPDASAAGLDVGGPTPAP